MAAPVPKIMDNSGTWPVAGEDACSRYQDYDNSGYKYIIKRRQIIIDSDK
jgi:hypothetical protein